MLHPEIMKFLADEHVETLRRDARGSLRTAVRPGSAVDTRDIELRLCTVGDDGALAELALLSESPLPTGRLVVAAVRGRIVAALPLAGGTALRDPFVRTAHLLPLLELRAAQLREPEPHRRLIPRYVSLMRGSTHA